MLIKLWNFLSGDGEFLLFAIFQMKSGIFPKCTVS